jgi:dTDP-4-amino-4,6-dideoxygalactose transaminase
MTSESIARRYLSEIKNDKIILPLWDLSDNHVFICLLFEQTTDRITRLFTEKRSTNCNSLSNSATQTKALQQYHELSFPITEKMHDEVLSIPLNPVIREEVDFIITALNKY